MILYQLRCDIKTKPNKKLEIMFHSSIKSSKVTVNAFSGTYTELDLDTLKQSNSFLMAEDQEIINRIYLIKRDFKRAA